MGASPWENHLLIGQLYYLILSYTILLFFVNRSRLPSQRVPSIECSRCALWRFGVRIWARSNIYRWFSNMLALNHGDFPHDATASVLLELGLSSSRRSWSALRPLMVRWGWHGMTDAGASRRNIPQKTSRFPSSPCFPFQVFPQELTPIPTGARFRNQKEVKPKNSGIFSMIFHGKILDHSG